MRQSEEKKTETKVSRELFKKLCSENVLFYTFSA